MSSTPGIAVDIRAGLSSSTAVKGPCVAATTANISLAGEKTIDGVVTSEDRVLVKSQTDTTENGIYYSSSGDWSRAPDFSRNDDVVPGSLVSVVGGSTNAGIWAASFTGSLAFDTTHISFVNFATLAGYLSSSALAAALAPYATTAATTSAIAAAVLALVNSAPAGLDTLGEIATAILALQDDASAAEIRAAAATKYITPANLQAALAEVALVDGATITIDLATGINFGVTLGGNRTLAVSNAASVIGRTGRVRIVQDGTGSRTLDTSAAAFKNVNGQDIVLSTAAAAEDVIYYDVISATKILLSMARAIS